MLHKHNDLQRAQEALAWLQGQEQQEDQSNDLPNTLYLIGDPTRCDIFSSPLVRLDLPDEILQEQERDRAFRARIGLSDPVGRISPPQSNPWDGLDTVMVTLGERGTDAETLFLSSLQFDHLIEERKITYVTPKQAPDRP